MAEQKDKRQKTDALGIDIQNSSRIDKLTTEQMEKKPRQEDTSGEIIAAQDDRSQDEGVDEQFGGDAADSRDKDMLDDSLFEK